MNRQCRTAIFFLLIMIGVFLFLSGWCFYLQYFRAEQYTQACIAQQRAYSDRKPQRGVILDCRGRVLAASNVIRTAFAEPRIIKDPKDTSTCLASIVDMGAHDICRLITESSNPGFVKVKTDLSSEQCAAASRIHGIGIQYDWLRHYPMGRLAAHVLGFTSADGRGLAGVEFQYDKNLQGSSGESVYFADVRRRPICPYRPFQTESEQLHGSVVPVDGLSLILSLDAVIQQFAWTELLKQYESYGAESALAIVAEPRTGALLAMVSLPDFDPADARFTDPNLFCNHAITDQFEPGSIIKPIVAAIALDAAAVNRDEKIFCEHGNYYGKGFGRIGEYRRGFGNLTVREILVESSNIGMAKIGQRLGKEKLYDGLKFFGFGKKVGIELPGEAEGLLRHPGQWTGYSVTRIPFGQEISVTAIQLVRAFCILANQGRLVRPHLVRATVDNHGLIIDAKPALPTIGYIVKPEIAKWIVTEAMTGVVNEGTGKKAKLGKWQVFGKTGTAQLAASKGGGYQEGAYIASFIAGAPVEDPRVIVLVSVRKPNVSLGKGYTGGTVAAPVAAAILKKTLNYLQIPQRNKIPSHLTAKYTRKQ